MYWVVSWIVAVCVKSIIDKSREIVRISGRDITKCVKDHVDHDQI